MNTKYVAQLNVPGSILEFGVWKGGALELICEALNLYGDSRPVFGFDTFDGHPMPNSDEFDIWGKNMQLRYKEVTLDNEKWAYASYDDVSKRLSKYKNLTLV